MKNIPFDSTGLEPSEIETLLKTYQRLRSKFSVTFGRSGGGLHFKRYNLLKDYSKISIRENIEFALHDFKCYLYVFNVEYIWIGARGARHTELENQFYGVVNLNKDFGHVLIRKESITDKISELFTPMEVDFETDSEFSRQFYVVAEDKDKAKSGIDANFRKAVLGIRCKNILIEIVNNQLVIATKTVLNTHNALEFVKFMKAIAVID
jgi:hypothetical protein